MSEVVAKFFDRALQSDIDLGVEVQPASIRADPSLLDDLLSNLVDNALKYTPAGRQRHGERRMQNGRPYLAVEDTGPGIPEGERQRVRAEILSAAEFARTRQRIGSGHRR